MKRINRLDTVNKNFVERSEQNLLDTEGGVVITLTTG